MHEFELIKNYFSKLAKNKKISLNLNDDVFFDKSNKLVISIDTYVEGIHFINFKRPDLVIRKIIRSSISDLICKGVRPKYYFISGSGNKKSFSKQNLKLMSKSLDKEQKKYQILLCGGDTTLSNKLSFTITSVGFSNKILLRNKAKLNDDIYVCGNLGDSFAGLYIQKRKIKTNKILRKYFINKYFSPDLNMNITNELLNFANTSIDISDGLITDLDKLINRQRLSYKIFLSNIPISTNLSKFIRLKKLDKKFFISRGDDYQILFTASPLKKRIITKISKSSGIKISKIGKICSISQKSHIFDEKGNKIELKDKGYCHQF